ncbi:acyl-CoA synthetase FdrA [Geomonas subterranea]|uniref:Acyl-CoA synthetase FdrA n=1 Tax=Geomonas subterranea TaxID=2847989 RepID=A0ABX8LLU0_9BACT|nr:acyl-CoA synthetase FdrA [Geomonas subterranea]QXE92653.1 acyl-CoA synthetase FdrA [Geomonas subterranea]QXM09248.1 acyl-CoA synthetase FdrA [Geomonas subterranea]
MAITTIVRKNEYKDSVRLMTISRQATALEGVRTAQALLGTEGNKKVLDGLGQLDDEVRSATPNDLVICIEADSEESCRKALEEIDRLLADAGGATAQEKNPESLEEAHLRLPGANLALFSVPGQFAKLDAVTALDRGLNVMLFSDNIAIEDEVELKRLAVEKDLLLMGPDCGTAIINGTPLGFANVIRRGSIGIVGASGTGVQEVTCLIDRAGGGISHAIGVGGRDLKKEVGGAMMRLAIKKLAKDPATKSLVLISKPGAPQVMADVLAEAANCGLPVVACLLGRDAAKYAEVSDNITVVSTLEEAACAALKMQPPVSCACDTLRGQAAALASDRQFFRALYSGGTLCYEALLILDGKLPVHSNIALDKEMKLAYPAHGSAHYAIDLGEDEFTQGRPHPMIDSTLRQERIVAAVSAPDTKVLLIDVVIGYGANSDPAQDMVAAVCEGRAAAKDGGPVVIAHVCGTDQDPQSLHAQEEKLKAAGIFTFSTNAAAVRAALNIVTGA